MPDDCPFCKPDAHRIWQENDCGFLIWDAFPVTEGHALVVPRQHVARFYELSEDMQTAIWKLVGEARARLVDQLQPDGFNIGLNDGPASGQTVMHVHIHVIPRWENDVPDPRGGIRWVIPEKARYWDD